MDLRRPILLFIALFVTVSIAFIPAFIGFSLPNFEVETEDRWVPATGTEGTFYHILDLYYILFILFSVTPFMTLLLWSLSSSVFRSFLKGRYKKDLSCDWSDLLSKNNGPKVSVIIPCYNEAMHVGAAVMGAIRQSYDHEIEVVVVDDGSSDMTWSIGHMLKGSFQNRSLKLIHKENGGKASALFAGIKASSGSIIVTTDGDSQLDRDAVKEIVSTFRENPDAGVVGGYVSIRNSHVNFLTKLQEFEYLITQDMVRMNQSDDGSVLIAPGPVFGMRADLARLFIPTDRTIVEDCDLTQSVLSTKMTTRSNEKARSHTHAPETLRRWLDQRTRWIYGQYQAWRENRWHLKRNPWAVYTYFTWVSTAVSAFLFFSFIALTIVLTFSGSHQYTLIGFITARSLVILLLYFGTRGLILLLHKETRRYVHYLPLLPLYDLLLSILAFYLYFRYMFGLGARVRWGGRRAVVH